MVRATVAETVAELAARDSTTRLSHPAGSEAAAVFRDERPPGAAFDEDDRVFAVVTDANEVLRVTPYGSYCPCGNNEEYVKGRGTPAKTAQQEREKAGCKHANLVRECEYLEACPECGGHSFDSATRLERRGGVALEEQYCGECGEKLA
jgi:hypothetical protein